MNFVIFPAKKYKVIVVSDDIGNLYELRRTLMVEKTHSYSYAVKRSQLREVLKKNVDWGWVDGRIKQRWYKEKWAVNSHKRSNLWRPNWLSIGCRFFNPQQAKQIIKWATGKP